LLTFLPYGSVAVTELLTTPVVGSATPNVGSPITGGSFVVVTAAAPTTNPVVACALTASCSADCSPNCRRAAAANTHTAGDSTGSDGSEPTDEDSTAASSGDTDITVVAGVAATASTTGSGAVETCSTATDDNVAAATEEELSSTCAVAVDVCASPPTSVDSVLPEVVAVKPDLLASAAPDAGVLEDLAERFTFAEAGAAAAVSLRGGSVADTLPPLEDTFSVIVEVVTATDASPFDAADDQVGAPDTG
jgi:hypothetical protein